MADLPKLTDPREIRDLVPGEAGTSITPSDPRCRGQCVHTDRLAHDSPARFGTERGTGRRVVWCPCCGHELWPEDRLSPEQRKLVIDNLRPANLNPALVAGRHKRFIDLVCWYDVVVMKEVREKDGRGL